MDKMYRDYVRVPLFLKRVSKKLVHTHEFQRKLGLEPTVDTSTARYNDIPKLINNVFGIEIPRKHSPLAHMIRSIMQSSCPPLDADSADFLNSHKNIIYIAFDQNAAPTNKDVQMVMQSLLILLEQGCIDGIIWVRFNINQLPETIKTLDMEYTDKDIINHKDIFFIKWAPQYAIHRFNASNSMTRRADIMEESLFASDDQGKQYYRSDEGYEIHWIKRNNLDIYTVFVILGFIILKIGFISLNSLRWKTFQKIKSAESFLTIINNTYYLELYKKFPTV
jgi:hypothetical protein